MKYLFVLLFGSLFLTSTAHALSLAPSYTCCEDWGRTGTRPDYCEEHQTVLFCEEQLNNPTPDYLVACWPDETEACKKSVDERVDALKAERQISSIDLNGDGVIGELKRSSWSARDVLLVGGGVVLGLFIAGLICFRRR